MKFVRILRPLLSLFVLSAILLSVVACGKEEPMEKFNRLEADLKERGFNVIRYGEGAENATLQLNVAEGVICFMEATRGSEYLRVKMFENEEEAAMVAKAWKESYEPAPNLFAEQDGNTIYYGSRSVYNLIKESYDLP